MSRFTPRRARDVADFIGREVLGLVTTHDAAGFISTPLPLLAETDAGGRVCALIGHFARANPHVARAQACPRALVTFFGPHGYVAPAMVTKPAWGPTWNYQLAQFEVDLHWQEDGGAEAIRALVARMEGDGAAAWTVARMGERFEQLAPQVIAFRAEVVSASARFKLGQDEDPQTFAEILSGLGDTPLAHAMRAQAEG